MAVLAAVVVCATAGTARAGTALIVTGHGWGHGVGMSQWGAYGYALHGWKYRRILSHYYPGTRMGRVGELHVRVLLAHRASSVTVGCAAPLRVTDGRRLTRTLPAGTYGVGSRLVFPVRRHGAGFLVRALRLARVRPRSAHLRRARVPRDAGPPQSGRRRVRRQRRSARHVPPRRRPVRVAVALAPRSAGGTGGRRPLLRRLGAAAELVVRPGADHRRPGLRRRLGREAELRPRRVRDARPGPHLGRPGRADVLLLELRRSHRSCAGRVARHGADPVPALGAGSLRHLFAAPRLGPLQLSAATACLAARPRRPRRVGAGRAGQQLPRRVGRLPARLRLLTSAAAQPPSHVAAPPLDVVLDR